MKQFGSMQEQDSQPSSAVISKFGTVFAVVEARRQNAISDQANTIVRSESFFAYCRLPHCLMVGPETRVNTGIWNYLFRI
jgi:hypothetical protein